MKILVGKAEETMRLKELEAAAKAQIENNTNNPLITLGACKVYDKGLPESFLKRRAGRR